MPNGNSARFISLKCCMPNGIPTIVRHSTSPSARCVRAMGIPPTNHHITFIIRFKQPPMELGEGMAEDPNGRRAIADSFRVCNPNGMPMIVTDRKSTRLNSSH